MHTLLHTVRVNELIFSAQSQHVGLDTLLNLPVRFVRLSIIRMFLVFTVHDISVYVLVLSWVAQLTIVQYFNKIHARTSQVAKIDFFSSLQTHPLLSA